MLRKVTVKIGLEIIDIQVEVIVETLLNSRATSSVMSSKFARKQKFKFKDQYIRNINSFFNKKRPIQHMVKVNIYYWKHSERIEIDLIRDQKWSVILKML